jgi:hypothetical protein
VKKYIDVFGNFLKERKKERNKERPGWTGEGEDLEDRTEVM